MTDSEHYTGINFHECHYLFKSVLTDPLHVIVIRKSRGNSPCNLAPKARIGAWKCTFRKVRQHRLIGRTRGATAKLGFEFLVLDLALVLRVEYDLQGFP